MAGVASRRFSDESGGKTVVEAIDEKTDESGVGVVGEFLSEFWDENGGAEVLRQSTARRIFWLVCAIEAGMGAATIRANVEHATG